MPRGLRIPHLTPALSAPRGGEGVTGRHRLGSPSAFGGGGQGEVGNVPAAMIP